MIAPLLWLLLSSLGLLHPASTGVHTWEGRAPVVVTHPSEPTAGDIVTVGIAGLPLKARKVAVVAATSRYPAARHGTLWETRFQPRTEGGPLNLVCPVRGRRPRVLGARRSGVRQAEKSNSLRSRYNSRADRTAAARKRRGKSGHHRARVPGNARTGKPDGKRNREQTAWDVPRERPR